MWVVLFQFSRSRFRSLKLPVLPEIPEPERFLTGFFSVRVNQGRDFKLNWQQSEGISRSSVLTLLMIFREENVILKVQQLRLQRPIHTSDLTQVRFFPTLPRFQSLKTQVWSLNWCFAALEIERVNRPQWAQSGKKAVLRSSGFTS